MKKGEKGLKNASFWVINSKNFRGGVFRPPPPAVSRGFAPPAAKLFAGGKKQSPKRGALYAQIKVFFGNNSISHSFFKVF